MKASNELPKKPPFYPWLFAAVFLYGGFSWLGEYLSLGQISIHMAGRVGAVYTGTLAILVIAASLLAGFAFLSYGIYLRLCWQKSK
jgi:hypothetical protein